jgi:hypothetical protein
MKTFARFPKTILLAVLVTFGAGQASALSIREFRKFNGDDQAMVLTASVNMLVFTYAADGKVAQAGCIQRWFFGKSKEASAAGPQDLATEIAAAERSDPDKFQIEGIILGVTDRVCPPGKPKQ